MNDPTDAPVDAPQGDKQLSARERTQQEQARRREETQEREKLLREEVALLREQIAAGDERMGEMESRLNLILGGEKGQAPPIEIVAGALDVEKSAAHLLEIWPLDATRRPAARIIAKEFEVLPTGKALKMGLPAALVRNCSDEGDAKAAYFRKLGLDPVATTVQVRPAAQASAAA